MKRQALGTVEALDVNRLEQEQKRKDRKKKIEKKIESKKRPE